MLQQRQIVKISGKQMDIEDPVFTKYAITSFLPIAWMLISSIIVTINRTEYGIIIIFYLLNLR
jgi:hypothetical protein